MNYLKDIFIVVISSMIGASLSQIFTILAERRRGNPSYNMWYKIKFYLAIIDGGLFLLSIWFLITSFLLH